MDNKYSRVEYLSKVLGNRCGNAGHENYVAAYNAVSTGSNGLSSKKKTGTEVPVELNQPLGRVEEKLLSQAAAHQLYADSPCELMSRPSRSSSSDTRSPITIFTISSATAATTPDHMIVTPTALAWMSSWSVIE